MDGTVAWISYTAVKGLRLRAVEAVDLSQRGAPGDRRFHLIDQRGHLANAKRVGSLQQVEADWDEESSRLTLHFPSGEVVTDEIRTNGQVTTNFYGRPVDGLIVDGPFAAALSDFTGVALRLVQPAAPGTGIDRGRKGAVTMLSEAALAPLADVAGVDA